MPYMDPMGDGYTHSKKNGSGFILTFPSFKANNPDKLSNGKKTLKMTGSL